MRIQLEICELQTTGKFKEDFSILWKRGPESANTQDFKFNGNSDPIAVNGVFEKVSTFYMKREVWQAKSCDFTLKSAKGKDLQKMTYDMTLHLKKDLGDIRYTFNKYGVTMVFKFHITPVDGAGRQDMALS